MDELFELFYTFLDGVTEEAQLRTLCEGLMEAFGKTKQVRFLACQPIKPETCIF